MKNFLGIFLLLSAICLGQTVPGTYPYPVPLPTSGATPAATVKVTGPINTPGYADNRPAIWDSFVGGGTRSVNTTAERDAILSGRRKQGMFVWVAADKHLYQLDSNLTSWTDLGETVSNILTPIYRGSATGGPGTFVALNADIDPDYIPSAVPPEYTVAAIRFDAASQGNDTLRLGNASADTPIKRPDGSVIQANDIAPSQVVLLTRTGTSSGSVWTLQTVATTLSPAPPNNMVAWIDSTSDLDTSTEGIVITKGYTTAGDGGAGAYRLDSSSTDTINNVTVFDCDSGGRYLLINSGSISAKQAGAVADGITNDNAALQAGLDASEGQTFRIDPGSYLCTGGLDIPDGTKVIARDATISITTTGETGVAVGSRCIVDGGYWSSQRLSGGANGFDNSLFTFGNYVSAGSVSNSIVKNVEVAMVGYGASCFFITGGSENISIDTVEHGDSATLDDVVTGHWGYVSGSEANGTLHPHNITVRNINVGELTSGVTDGSPVFFSGCYNVLVENVTSRKARHGAIMVAGDFGFKYSGFAAQTLGSVVYRNITCLNASNIGVLISGVGVAAAIYPQEFVLENSTIFGPNDGSNNGGLYLNTSRNFTARNSLFAGHNIGTTFTGGNKGTILDACTFTTNYLAGISINDANTEGARILSCKVYNNGRSLSGNSAAGITLLAGSRATIANCLIGNSSGTEPNQEVGIKVIPTFLNATLINNYVYGVKGGGLNVAYYLGAASDTGHLYLVNGNQAAAGITLLSGPDQIPYLKRGTFTTYSGTGTPTIGAYIAGDRVTIDAAVSTPFELVCTSSGTPGGWATTY